MNRKIKYLVVDVDGTMTDAGIYYDDNGNELKKFCTKDAAGFHAAKHVGIKLIVLTGRKCAATEKRMVELKADYLFQGIKDKVTFLRNFIKDNGILKAEIGYVGDDLNDLAPMKLTGFVACPSDSCNEVKNIANYISNIKGGQGVIRNVVEYILTSSGEWDGIVKDLYESGI